MGASCVTTRTGRTCAGATWLAACGLLLAGCGGQPLPTYPAGGKVVFPDGTPLTGGWVEFQPVQAAKPVGARGEIQPDGTFRLSTFAAGDGAVEGEHRALVQPPLQGPDVEAAFFAPPIIDPRLRDFETSGLKFTVTRSRAKNHFEIQVQRPAARN